MTFGTEPQKSARQKQLKRQQTIRTTSESNWRRRRGIEKMAFIIWPEKINQDDNLSPTEAMLMFCLFHHCLSLVPGIFSCPPLNPTTSIPLCTCIFLWGGSLTPSQVSAVSPHLPIGSIPTYQVLSMPYRLQGETVSLLVMNLWISVKQERKWRMGSILCQCLHESLEAAGS